MLVHISTDFAHANAFIRACELYMSLGQECYFFIQRTREYMKIFELNCYVGNDDKMPSGTIATYKVQTFEEAETLVKAAFDHYDEIFNCESIEELLQKLKK